MRWLARALAALAVVVIALLAWTPAALVLPQQVPALSLKDVRGTIWHGQAGQVYWQGHALGTLAWRAEPGSLLRGDPSIRLQLSGPLGGAARLHPGFARHRLEDLRIVLPAQWLDGVLATPALQPHGQIELRLARLVFERAQWQVGDGQARWRAATLTGVAVAPLGDLRADFAGVAPGRIEGRLRDEGGPLALAGHFVVDAAGYRVVATLAAREPVLGPALAWLGQPTASGRRIELQGPLAVPAPALATF